MVTRQPKDNETASQTEDAIEKIQSNSGVYLVPAFTGQDVRIGIQMREVLFME